jgi:S-DNA-T family DNA segregation ATPase FtsK/SpoIIIE
LRRAQGTYIEDDELAKVLEFLGEQGRAEFHPELVKIPGAGADVGELDPLYDNAVEVVLDTKRGSVSLLQRRLTIGYSRASRLIEQMAATGIVGEYKGSQAREVLITLDEWKTMKQSRAMNDSLDAVAAPFEVDVDGPSSGSGDVFDASDADSDDGGAASSRSKPAAVGSKDMERRHAQSSVDDDDGWEEYDDDTDDDDDDDLDDDELDDEDDDFDDDDDLGDDDDVEDRAPDASRDPR